jgi:hypothetical protein
MGEGVLCLGFIVMMHPASRSSGLATLVPHQVICMRESRLIQLLIPLAIVTYIPYEILVSNLYFSILYTYTSTSWFFISERELVVIRMVYLKHCNSKTAGCVRNSMKFKITDTCTMCTCSEMFLILWIYATAPEAKKLTRTSK